MKKCTRCNVDVTDLNIGWIYVGGRLPTYWCKRCAGVLNLGLGDKNMGTMPTMEEAESVALIERTVTVKTETAKPVKAAAKTAKPLKTAKAPAAAKPVVELPAKAAAAAKTPKAPAIAKVPAKTNSTPAKSPAPTPKKHLAKPAKKSEPLKKKPTKTKK